ncbi:MAG TPA: hypothetical protein VFX15_09700 [Actinomycetes bacterium]|nr:hypothetical protein [Actinomycetes bacterium]
MSSVLASIERVVSRVQISRYEQQQRVAFRRDRDAHERVSMQRQGIVVAGARPTSL